MSLIKVTLSFVSFVFVLSMASEEISNPYTFLERLDNNKNGYIECEEFARGGLDKKIFNFTERSCDKNINSDDLTEDERSIVELIAYEPVNVEKIALKTILL